MDEDVSLHLVAPEDTGLAERLSGLDPRLHDSVAAFTGSADEEPCVVVLSAEARVDCGDLLDLCRTVAEEDRRWVVLVAEDGDDGVAFRPLSSGFALDAEGVEALLEAEAPPFELHEVLRFVARIRHDINNPLTAGMAETQLLLMDLGGEGEVGESLRTIERQLQRIQALVQDLTLLRRPSRD